MWQRFTERTRRILFFAQEEAARLGENSVGTEHLLLGMVRDDDSAAVRIMKQLGASPKRIRQEVERQVPRGAGRLGQEMQLTPHAKRVIDRAYEESRSMKVNYVGSEHLLLGLIRDDESIAGRVLADMGVDLERARHEARTLKNGDGVMPQGSGSFEDHVQEFNVLKLLTSDGPVSLPLDAIREMTVKMAQGEFTGRFMNITTERIPRQNPPQAPPADGVQDEPPADSVQDEPPPAS